MKKRSCQAFLFFLIGGCTSETLPLIGAPDASSVVVDDDAGPADAGQPDAGRLLSFEEYCVLQTQLQAQKQHTCVGGSLEYWQRRYEQSHELSSCLGVAEAIDRGRAAFHASRVGACFAAIEHDPCGVSAESLPEECRDVVVGLLEEGEVCRAFYDRCEPGLTCDDWKRFSHHGYPIVGACSQKCAPISGPLAEGALCTGVGFECASGLVCDIGLPVHQCRRIPIEGEHCIISCADGFYCENETSVCRAQVALGESCSPHSSNSCAPSLVCIEGEENSICAPGKIGSVCAGHEECPLDAYCGEDECRVFPLAGESCSDMICAPGAFCPSRGEKICALQKLDREPCEDLNACWLGRCVDGACQFLSGLACDSTE